MSTATFEPSSTIPHTHLTPGRPTRRARRALETDTANTDVLGSFKAFKAAIFAPHEDDETKENLRFTNIGLATAGLVRCFEGGLNTDKSRTLRKAYRMTRVHAHDFIDFFPASIQEN